VTLDGYRKYTHSLIIIDPLNTNISNITFISDYETTSEAWSNVSESNSTSDGIPESPYTEWQMGLVTFILLVLIIGTIIGNSLVCSLHTEMVLL
jgi:hypothetical protein